MSKWDKKKIKSNYILLVSSQVIYACDQAFFFFFSSVVIFFIQILDNFVLKKWINKRIFYFVSILSEVRDIFLLSYLHKNSIQRGESFYK